MAVIKDLRGRVLASSQLATAPGEPRFVLLNPDGREELFAYFFFRHGRAVRVEVDDVQFAGRLVTHWQGNRRTWEVLVAQPDAVPTRGAKEGVTLIGASR